MMIRPDAIEPPVHEYGDRRSKTPGKLLTISLGYPLVRSRLALTALRRTMMIPAPSTDGDILSVEPLCEDS